MVSRLPRIMIAGPIRDAVPAATTGHKSVDTLRGYVRDAELFKDHAGAGLL